MISLYSNRVDEYQFVFQCIQLIERSSKNESNVRWSSRFYLSIHQLACDWSTEVNSLYSNRVDEYENRLDRYRDRQISNLISRISYEHVWDTIQLLKNVKKVIDVEMQSDWNNWSKEHVCYFYRKIKTCIWFNR